MTEALTTAVNDKIGGGAEACVMHASCVSYENHAVLILGPSGIGKSSLALQLMALGAVLVADDKTCLRKIEGWGARHGTSNHQGHDRGARGRDFGRRDLRCCVGTVDCGFGAGRD